MSSSSSLAWLDLAQDPQDVNHILVIFFFCHFNGCPQKFTLEFSLKADIRFEQQANSLLPVLKLHSRTTMSELFRRGPYGDEFDAVLKLLDGVFLDDIANLCAERGFSWNPVPAPPKSSE